jgi:uncharacterized protein (TIGR02001 family)
MQKTVLALATALAASALPGIAQAADEPAASPLSFNVGAVTDYRYRGISQSRLKPAISGGADYALASGLYVGTWASTISWIKDGGKIYDVDTGNTAFEWDFYGGYKGDIAKDFSYDVGGLYYLYAGNKYGNIDGAANANTFELYGALTYGVVTAKYSRAMTNLFGFGNSKGSDYFELAAAIDMGNGWSLTPHYGHQGVKNFSVANYNDFSLTVAKDLGNGISLSAAVLGTDANKAGYVTPDGKFTGKNALVVGAKYSF